MTYQDHLKWEQFFKDFSYKPNWEFDYQYQPDFDDQKVFITMRVPDSRRPLPEPTPLDNLMGKRTVIPAVPINKTVMLGPFHGEAYAKDYIRHHIIDMEIHEVDEWFRYQGELVFDPHKENS